MNTLHPFLNHPSYPLPLPMAHRGYSARFPENTMAAFSAAISLGYKYLETDVHATSDGKLVAFHDTHLERVTNGQGVIEDLTWNELKKLKVKETETIPLLEDILTTWPSACVLIDPKEDSAVKPLYGVLSRLDVWDRVCVGSFSDQRIAWIRKEAGAKLCTSMSPKEIRKLRFRSWSLPLKGFGAQCVQAPVKQKWIPILDRSFINTAHNLGFPVHAWTINDVVTMEKLLDLNIDAIMTDEAETLKAVFKSRNIWHD